MKAAIYPRYGKTEDVVEIREIDRPLLDHCDFLF